MKVKELIEKLEDLDHENEVICQVIADNGMVWNMFVEVNDVKNTELVQLKVSHPELIDLISKEE